MDARFAHVEDWIFDLDNTLYPASTRLFDLIDERMTAYVGRVLGSDPAEARRVQKQYFRDHGTTLAGLMQHHDVEPRHFLDDVHAIALDRVTPDDLSRFRFVVRSMAEAIRDGRTDVVVSTNIAFHDLLYSVAANRTLSHIGKDLSDYVRRFSAEAFTSAGRVEQVLAEHERILEELERGDPDEAERTSREHLRKARENVALLHARVIVGGDSAADGRS